jgi:GAF domain-containing protein
LAAAVETVVKIAQLHTEQSMEQNNSARAPQASVSAVLNAARAEASARAAGVRFPGEDGGRSLAEMAQRDLDAALQLLADRAQYITGATGAAIALRRSGKNDMLCRASTGPIAPELGALLSTEFGLSGESVRTRQPLRCDDAERDVRVNRDVCRQMGIASVVVMPVVNDDEVLGVFELFSGKANAFGARDVSAVQRLSEMVETAVRLAQAAESLPERLKMQQASAPAAKDADVLEDQNLAGQVLEDVVLEEPVLEDSVLETPAPVAKITAEKSAQESASSAAKVPAEQGRPVSELKAAAPLPVEAKVPTSSANSGQALSQRPLEDASAIEQKAAVAPAKKPLFWSAALAPAADAGKAEEADQSHVPPVLRSLRKCESCGFPVSAGRALCVECEEKKWRGQLKVPKAATAQAVVSAPTVAAPATGKTEARAFAAVAQAAGVAAVATTAASGASGVAISAAVKESEQGAGQAAVVAPQSAPVHETAVTPVAPERSSGEFVLSAGLEPSQSWVARNKYVLGVLLVVGVAVAAVFLLR